MFRTVQFRVAPKTYETLSKMAKVAGVPPSAYAQMLFDAAYAVRSGETHDIDLDKAVARVALLGGAQFDFKSISDLVGLKETTCEVIWGAWRKEIAGQNMKGKAA